MASSDALQLYTTAVVGGLLSSSCCVVLFFLYNAISTDENHLYIMSSSMTWLGLHHPNCFGPASLSPCKTSSLTILGCVQVQLALNILSVGCAGFSVLTPYRPFFLGLTTASLGYSHWKHRFVLGRSRVHNPVDTVASIEPAMK
jgi:hypothetical protein